MAPDPIISVRPRDPDPPCHATALRPAYQTEPGQDASRVRCTPWVFLLADRASASGHRD